MHEPAQLQAILLALILMMTLCGVLPLAIFAGWMWSFGGRVTRGARYPPIDARRWKVSRVLEGDAARSRGMLFRTGGAVLMAGAVASVWGLWVLWSALT